MRKKNAIRSRVIFHVDMDSFYASCELARNPNLKDSPFIVGADPKAGKGRGVVLACNYTAKKIGLKSGMPISKAWELCPSGVYVSPNHKLYGEVSSRIMEILREFTERMEQVSIDEAYLDLSDDAGFSALSERWDAVEGAIRSVAFEVKKRVREREGVTCSIGVSNSKIVSKIASDFQKPDGLTIVSPNGAKEFLAPLPVERIPGVGRVSQRILYEEFNVKTISDLLKPSFEDLRERFGRSALWLRNVAEGVDESEVITRWEPVSQSGETTFEQDESDYAKVSSAMREVAEDVHRRVRAEGYLYRNVGIKIRFEGFETHTRSRMLSLPTDSLEIVVKECEKLLSEFSSSGRRVRLIGVRLSELERKERGGQRTLLDWSF